MASDIKEYAGPIVAVVALVASLIMVIVIDSRAEQYKREATITYRNSKVTIELVCMNGVTYTYPNMSVVLDTQSKIVPCVDVYKDEQQN